MATEAKRLRQDIATESGWWWLFLITGILWVIVAFMVLQLNLTTVGVIAVMAGVLFLAAGANEFLVMATIDGWKWLHALLGALFILAGIAAFAWPGRTFFVLASIVGWYLLFKGTFDIVAAVAERGAELWWLQLVVGIAEVLIAFWAVGYPGRSVVLLAVWVGAAALARGITEIVFAFQLRGSGRGATAVGREGSGP